MPACLRTRGLCALLGLMAGLVIAPTPSARAQAPSLERGDRVRLFHPCGDDARSSERTDRSCAVVGEFLRLEAGNLVLDGEPVREVRLASVRRLEVSAGDRSYGRVGAAAGFLAGAIGTWVIVHRGGSTSLCDRSANQDAINTRECLGVAALGGLAGAGVGALIGGFIRTERWEAVPLERLRVSLRPASETTIAFRMPL